MFYVPELLISRAQSYCTRIGTKIEDPILGCGLQGMVFSTSNQSAIKVHAEKEGFWRELKAYSRLGQYDVREVRGITVPTLRAFDESLQLIEMSLVRPPFIVDFGGAYLDEPPTHATDPGVKARWMAERDEKFEDNSTVVNAILAELEMRFGIYLTDVHPGNIRLVQR
jgi:hypothetical protein